MGGSSWSGVEVRRSRRGKEHLYVYVYRLRSVVLHNFLIHFTYWCCENGMMRLC